MWWHLFNPRLILLQRNSQIVHRRKDRGGCGGRRWLCSFLFRFSLVVLLDLVAEPLSVGVRFLARSRVVFLLFSFMFVVVCWCCGGGGDGGDAWWWC